jgi:hypothetical protein
MNTTINNKSTTSNPMSELFAKVMDKFDTDKDKKLNATEFGAFLSGLIGDNQAGAASQDEPAAPAPRVQASTFMGFTPKYAMEGFDCQREQNTGKSAKDAFAFLANQAPPPPLHDKAALGAWFTQYIQPGMNDLGHKVSNVEGDKFVLENWQGQFNVDFGRGAGANGAALAWQVG